MKFAHKNLFAGLIALTVFSSAITASALLPIRGSSQNGTNTGATQWLLIGRTAKQEIQKNGKSVFVQSEVVCPGQDVEATVSNPTESRAGSCDSGNYLFIFQFQSTSTDVTITFKQLGGFVPNQSPPNYGALVCDNNDPQNGNTLELCTNNPDGSQIPDITFTSVSPHTVTFQVPNFPNFKAGTTQQGQGLTLFLLAPQTGPLPIHLPVPSIQ